MPRNNDRADRPEAARTPDGPLLWSMPVNVDDIPDDGSHIELEADEAVRAAMATAAGVVALPRLTAAFDLAKTARGVAVTGQVEATVAQTCVVTLEPIENRVVERVDLVFAAPDDPAMAGDDPPEPLLDGVLDLGGIAAEFVMLGIDPYPRKKGVEFVSPALPDGKESPFSALAALKKDKS